MSNIRRRNQGAEEPDPYNNEDFMRRDRTKVFSDDDYESIPEFTSVTEGGALWENYRIKPGTSIEDMVEILMVNFGKTAFEVEVILQVTQNEANKHVTALENRLRSIGKPLDGEDKELQRGLAIRKLQLYIQDISYELATNRDPRLMTARLAAQREMNSLLELAIDKKDKGGIDTVNTFDAAIGALSKNKICELQTFLRMRYPS